MHAEVLRVQRIGHVVPHVADFQQQQVQLDAQEALAAWDGAPGTEPQGWHRHPTSGRRRTDGKPELEHVAW